MIRRHRFMVLAPLAALIALAPALGGVWEIDGVHSFASFKVRHLVITTVHGEFGKISGTIDYDGKDLASIMVDATIDTASITTHVTKRDEDLRSPNFFDVGKYPSITFKSKKAAAAGAGKFTLTGDLTMHGVTKEVTLDVEGPTETVKDPWGNTRMGAHASTKLNRKDFGIIWDKKMDSGGAVVSDEVAVVLDLELVRKTRPGSAPKMPPPPPSPPPAAPKPGSGK